MTDDSGYLTPSSPRVDKIRYGNWGSRPFEYAWAAGAVKDWSGLRVLDLGCAPPHSHTWGRWLVDNKNPKTYIGVDQDGEMADHGERYSRPPQERYIHGDFTNLRGEVQDKSQDVVLFLSVQEHLSQEVLRDTVAEVDRVLTEDGVVLVTMDEIWDYRRIPDSLCSWNELEKDLPTWLRLETMCSLTLRTVTEVFWGPKFEPTEPIPTKVNADQAILHSLEWNCCVSHAILRRKRS